ncbi:MAG: Ig-like domain-containing protein, partial [Candidatus Limnocylindrales bacterium]
MSALAPLLPRLLPSVRLRTVALAALFGFATFAVQATPTDIPLPRPEALTPAPVAALGCADEPEFVGHIANTSATTAIATKSTTGNVYGYISDVEDDWSCTAYYRYDGLAWRRLAPDTTGIFDWGTLIHSTSVPCNWVIGETNYLKANDTTDCGDSDAEYAMQITLAATTGDPLLEAIWHADSTPDQTGDFMFIHSDCTSYYESSGMSGERVRYGVSFSPSEVLNRPGDNCDPTVLDSTGTNQTITVDGTDPITGSSVASLVDTRTVPVAWTATDNVAGIASVRLYRATAAAGPYTLCQTITTTATSGNSTCTVPTDGLFYLASAATDANGNGEPVPTAAEDSVVVDTVAPANGTIVVDAGAAWSDDPEGDVALGLSATDSGGSGLYQMRFSNDGTTWSAWGAYAASAAWVVSAGDGTKIVRVEYRDTALNVSSTASDTIGYDATLPGALIAIDGGATTTYDTMVTLDVTATDATSGVATTAASNDGSSYTAVSGSAPTWTLTGGSGTKTVWYRVTDTAGNVRTVTDTISLATDVTPPGEPPPPDLTAASDSGVSGIDDATNDASPTFTGTAEAGSTVTLYAGVTQKGSATADGSGDWMITASTITDGTYAITVTATDGATNVSDPSDPLSVTIDTVAPAAPSVPDLAATSDSGASDSDDVTSDATPTIAGTGETGSSLTVRADGTAVGSGSVVAGAWTVVTDGLGDGVRSLTAETIDVAGNTS